MNVDLIFPEYVPPPRLEECAGCSSFREHPSYVGWCVYKGAPRRPDALADVIGPNAYFEAKRNRVAFRGSVWTCFSLSLDISQCEISEPGFRYGSVTRTETAKSGQKTGSRRVNV